jgi:pyruvate,water dikinase
MDGGAADYINEQANILHWPPDYPSTLWTTTNIREAIPGVPTPLTWSIFGPAGEQALRDGFAQIGALLPAEAAIPAQRRDWVMGIFFGRTAMRIDLLAHWADRVPGGSGESLVRQFFSAVPGSLNSAPQRRYYPRVAARMAVPYITLPKVLRNNRIRVQKFWEHASTCVPAADRSTTLALFDEAVAHFRHSLSLQTRMAFSGVQTATELLERATRGTPISAHELMAGYKGHEETQLVKDMWACSRGALTVDEFVQHYGYHGWHEGELSSRTWRDDRSMLAPQFEAYRLRPDSENPEFAEQDRIAARHALEARLMAELPIHRRPFGRAAVRLASYYLPMRGISKVAFLQGLDIARLTARRLGGFLADAGVLNDAEDVFYLTSDELHGALPPEPASAVQVRKSLRARYSDVEIPDSWSGMPNPMPPSGRRVDHIEGVGASPGVVEGVARVVIDPLDAIVEPGEILVARETDPSWASLMFLSAGLVADIGGVMSHTAIVARELGIPCVVNTKIAITSISTGDRIRVDGKTGYVDIVSRGTGKAKLQA